MSQQAEDQTIIELKQKIQRLQNKKRSISDALKTV